jgi:hypothetical protein
MAKLSRVLEIDITITSSGHMSQFGMRAVVKREVAGEVFNQEREYNKISEQSAYRIEHLAFEEKLRLEDGLPYLWKDTIDLPFKRTGKSNN